MPVLTEDKAAQQPRRRSVVGWAAVAILLLVLLALPLAHPVTIRFGDHGFCVAAAEPGGRVSVSAIQPLPPQPRYGSNVFEEINLETLPSWNGVLLFDSGTSPSPPFRVHSITVRDHWLLLIVW